ncbi:MAG TPA: hypothetical protein VJ672_09110, partial [Gemmatimonadaceae bacterium]|nr:hypothetical protein [Gemmatimonadaceae bacterium]
MRSLLAAAVVATIAACGGENAGAQGPYARQVNDAIPVIERGTGLEFKQRPVVEEKTKDELRAYLVEQFRTRAAEDVKQQEILLRRLGLIPDSLKLGEFLVELYTEQVAGYYDPATKKLYIVKGTSPEFVSFTVSHELVHALQDQYANLDSLLKVKGADDQVMAAQAVVEGQAMLVPIKAMGGAAMNLPGGWDQVRQMVREQMQKQYPVLASAPNILIETSIFPYLSGLEFMRRVEAERPGKHPYGAEFPKSTEQILHPDKYLSAPDAPARITLPTLTGATGTYQNEVGEFPMRVFLYEHLRNQPDAVRIAAGWDGDRYVVLETPRGEGIAWVTAWDSTVDAVE